MGLEFSQDVDDFGEGTYFVIGEVDAKSLFIRFYYLNYLGLKLVFGCGYFSFEFDEFLGEFLVDIN